MSSSTDRWKLPDWLPPYTGPTLPNWRRQEAMKPETKALRDKGKLQIALSERWLIPGMTGSGKTTYSKRLVQEMRRLWPESYTYVLDSTHKGDFEKWPGIVEQDKPPKLLKRPGAIQVWQPSHDDQSAYDEWFEAINDAGEPAIVFVDELASICNKAGEAPLGYAKLQKQGRGKFIAMLTLSQEMAYMARQARTQATHMVRFGFLENGYDGRTANAMMGLAKNTPEPTHKYGFWHCRLDERPHKPIYYPSYKDFF